MRHRPGFVFLDSALPGEEHRLSVLASDPVGECRSFAEVGEALGRHRSTAGPDLGMPDGALIGCVSYDGAPRFGIYPELLVYDHPTDSWHGSPSAAARLRAEPVPAGAFTCAPAAEMGREEYVARVRRVREYIAAGDIYQANLARRYRGPFAGDAFAFYAALRDASPAPHAAWLDFGDLRVASASPESFLQIDGTRIRTRPIKGTRPRHADPGDDERSACELLTSSKEIAELVMITDLERNDLGQVCEYGSVRVRELLRLERFEQVFHLVSTVEGTLRAGIGPVEAFLACFPGGSITGAPKRRAREIIAELEPVPRGFYTGAIGWFGFNGGGRFSIAIRTAFLEAGEIAFHAGSGIVADSVPDAEYEETCHKASGLLRAAAAS
jgi:para-aminobenzoate synthetase component 1